MIALIEEFRKEHSEILAMLNEIKELGVLTHKGQAKLMSVKSRLSEHFSKEDEKYYPVLYKAAEQNEKLKGLLELLANSLQTLSIGMAEFFDKYNRGILDTKFEEEFENLFVALCKRMKQEEFILYDEYNMLSQQ
tara:strand:+ start:144 stop:548 length:405 start_codon:yes stop_codon:yes gene_type:complete